MSDLLAQAQAAYAGFTDGFRSVVLATVDAAGEPTASYAPCVIDGQRRIHCLVSGLAAHTANLQATRRASALFVEDESSAEQVFARKRLTFACDAEFLPPEHPDHAAVADAFRARFGGLADTLLGMPDFRAVRLTPRSGSFVTGFGAAFDLRGDDLDTLVHRKGGGGHGHGARPAPDHGAPAPVEAPASDVGADGRLPADAVQRMVDHMNADHADALVNYARAYGERPDARAARLLDVDAAGMELRVTDDTGAAHDLRIPFRKPLGSSADAHHVLVQMAIEARKKLEADQA